MINFFDIFKPKPISYLHWENLDNHLFLYTFPMEGSAIQKDAQLVVKKKQIAILVHNNKVLDCFREGEHYLNDISLPLYKEALSLESLPKRFYSEVYFFNTSKKLSFPFQNTNPIKVRSADNEVDYLLFTGRYDLLIISAEKLLTALIQNGDIKHLQKVVTETLFDALSRILNIEKKPVEKINEHKNIYTFKINQLVSSELSKFGLLLDDLAIDHATSYENIHQSDNDNEAFEDKLIASSSDNDLVQEGAEAHVKVSDETSTEENKPSFEIDPTQPKIYYLMVSGQRKGPLSMDEVDYMIQIGEVTMDTLYWTYGMSSWAELNVLKL